MKIIHRLVASRLWVAIAAAAWCVESFVRCDVWIRWTLVAQVFFFTWLAYLFLTDDVMRKQRSSVLVALTGACVTFQGLDAMKLPLLCAVLVAIYRTHWMPVSWRLARMSLRNIPILNNLVIGLCWTTLCMLWPIQQIGISVESQLPFLAAAVLWITALSMSEDMFVESTPDATLRLLGEKGIRALAIACVSIALIISLVANEQSVSVWISMSLSILTLLLLPGGKRTPGKSLLIDAMIVLRYPF